MKYIISEDVEVVLNGQRYLLEAGDTLINEISPEERLKILDDRLGVNVGAGKERKKLHSAIRFEKRKKDREKKGIQKRDKEDDKLEDVDDLHSDKNPFNTSSGGARRGWDSNKWKHPGMDHEEFGPKGSSQSRKKLKKGEKPGWIKKKRNVNRRKSQKLSNKRTGV